MVVTETTRHREEYLSPPAWELTVSWGSQALTNNWRNTFLDHYFECDQSVIKVVSPHEKERVRADHFLYRSCGSPSLSFKLKPILLGYSLSRLKLFSSLLSMTYIGLFISYYRLSLD